MRMGMVLWATVWLGACGPQEIRASDFDQTCSVDDDCTLVFEGDPCDCGSAAAISKSVAEEYKTQWHDAQDACLIEQNCAAFEIGSTTDRGVCEDGTCVIGSIQWGV